MKQRYRWPFLIGSAGFAMLPGLAAGQLRPSDDSTAFRTLNLYSDLVASSVRGGEARLDLLDVAGRRVMSLMKWQAAAGPYQMGWPPSGSGYTALAAGVYLLRLTVGSEVATTRVVLTSGLAR